MTERYSPRKTPSFSSSLLDSILRSIDESNDGALHDHNMRHQQLHDHDNNHDHNHDHQLRLLEPKRSNKLQLPRTNMKSEQEQMLMIDQWMETHSKNNNGYASWKSKFSSDSSSSGAETETPSTYRSLPNSFTIPRKTIPEADDTQNTKFMKSTKLKAMKKPTSPGSQISAFIHSLFASSSSSKKVKHEESMHNFKQDTTTTCTSVSRSCMSNKKKQPSSSVKRSVRFYPVTDTVILDKKCFDDERDSRLPKYERRRFTEKHYMKNYKDFMEGDDVDEDDLFELEEIVGTQGAYRQELPVFETTDLRKIRI